METLETAREILDTMLGYLGFVVQVEFDDQEGDPGLQVITAEPKPLIGRQGERLEDIQYLVNRLLQVRLPDAARVRVDIDHYRSNQEYRLIEEAERLAERVVATGKSASMEPMNSFFRRKIHTHFAQHPAIKTWSPDDTARLKRITLIPRQSATGAANES
ncbi:MAG: single-stranded DNA-binding protein [Verrucomicrobiae bacterium]|nr:single-stranded DNA-binding protein [Verrucomicrobiae bacterium]MCP5539294.1 single-stranded DNA-binding protein [Akkermansiaceae bacterium]